MSDYIYEQDGKVHTRYSELKRCTPAGVGRVIAERLNGLGRFESENMAFGTDRHEMWFKEGQTTGKSPLCFGSPMPLDYFEHEFAAEIMPGLVLHSRPDAVALDKMAIIDYKTMVAADERDFEEKAARVYGREAHQLECYAYQLGLHNIPIQRLIYMVEGWDATRENIIGYKVVEHKVDFVRMAKIIDWLEIRGAILMNALEGAEKEAENVHA